MLFKIWTFSSQHFINADTQLLLRGWMEMWNIWRQQLYIITVKQTGLEFQYTQGHFTIPIILAHAKNIYISCSTAATYLQTTLG